MPKDDQAVLLQIYSSELHSGILYGFLGRATRSSGGMGKKAGVL